MVSICACAYRHHRLLPLDAYTGATSSRTSVCFRAANCQRSPSRALQGCVRCSLSFYPLTSANATSSDERWDFLQDIEATKFMDNYLLDVAVKKDGEIRQIVLLTDGAHLIPSKLPSLPAILIFHVASSPSTTINPGGRKNLGLPKSLHVCHVSTSWGEVSDWKVWPDRLVSAGYQGDRPSLWLMQGLKFFGPNGLESILHNVGSLSMKGSFFVGEIPITASGCTKEEASRPQLDKLFLSHGFSMKSFFFLKTSSGALSVLFEAEQLCLSDAQVSKVMREIQLAEEAGDEETFEDWQSFEVLNSCSVKEKTMTLF